jgi:hypothetical protein
MSPVDLSLYVPVAENCCVAPIAKLAAFGDIEIEVSVFAPTVTVALAIAVVLPAPVAVAVYVVVAAGVTVMVPPVAPRVFELPSLPLTVTPVAFVALIVNVEEFPGVMEAGFATILTVGAGLAVTVTVAFAETVAPLVPVAVAVYVVVAVGLTTWVPPAAPRV